MMSGDARPKPDEPARTPTMHASSAAARARTMARRLVIRRGSSLASRASRFARSRHRVAARARSKPGRCVAEADPGLAAEAAVVAHRLDRAIEGVREPRFELPIVARLPGDAKVEDGVAAEDDAVVGTRADEEPRDAEAPRAGHVVRARALLVRGATRQTHAGVPV